MALVEREGGGMAETVEFRTATPSRRARRTRRAAVRSLFEKLEPDGAGHVDLWFGPQEPDGAEGRWVQTVPGRGWFAYFRIYGPRQAALDGSWKPGDFERQH
ncbi:DUF1214 domain-containing protein [Streptomyces sp. NPDC020917]|uniref:DUF1214 domain-containing protein n=1 Tax=Streptomyces sp. NPDC020917 TaxID=3365102 RepID=UPI003799D9C2